MSGHLYDALCIDSFCQWQPQRDIFVTNKIVCFGITRIYCKHKAGIKAEEEKKARQMAKYDQKGSTLLLFLLLLTGVAANTYSLQNVVSIIMIMDEYCKYFE